MMVNPRGVVGKILSRKNVMLKDVSSKNMSSNKFTVWGHEKHEHKFSNAIKKYGGTINKNVNYYGYDALDQPLVGIRARGGNKEKINKQLSKIDAKHNNELEYGGIEIGWDDSGSF